MICTFIDNKYNDNIRICSLSWKEFTEIIANAPEMYDKGNGAIIGGLCTWDPVSFHKKPDGYVTSGRNRKCVNRQIIILDVDNPKPDFLERAKNYFAPQDTAWGYYTTFSATEENPRYRLCSYLDRAVSNEEYKKIAEAIIYDLGDSEFDPVSSNANQIMYLGVIPIKFNHNTCIEESYYKFDFFGCNPINSTQFLNYIDNNWTEHFSKYKPKRSHKSISSVSSPSASQKLVDPRTKSSIVGTFTSLFSIDYVMENFLSSIYVKVGNRYKPINSNSAPGGRIVENGQYYLTSHSHKDKAYGSLKNSYDLVLCNFEDLVTPKQLEELKHQSIKRGNLCPTIEQCMYEWAMNIPEVYEKESERINNRKDETE